MPSHSLEQWRTTQQATSRGRRYAIEQVNHAYAMLLSSQFQGFCRDLHSECIDHVVGATTASLAIQTIIREQFTWGRALDVGNPIPSRIGSDFGRFGIRFWRAVQADHRHSRRRQGYLEELNRWRNAIAHHDFDPTVLGGTTVLRLATVKQSRSSLDGLATSFDNVMRDRLRTLVGAEPWVRA